jgi:hypothetical protein
MILSLWQIFLELIKTPFRHEELIWGIVPLYFAWALNEMTSPKASFRTAIQTGFSFIWAGIQWIYPLFQRHPNIHRLKMSNLFVVNLIVTIIVGLIGIMALWSGIRRRYPKYGSFLGHSRFSNYFMITIFPIQANFLDWSLMRLVAIVIFAIPIWGVVSLAFLPLRLRK